MIQYRKNFRLAVTKLVKQVQATIDLCSAKSFDDQQSQDDMCCKLGLLWLQLEANISRTTLAKSHVRSSN